MKTMTENELKDALINGILFNESITILGTLYFHRDIDININSLPDNLTVEYLDFLGSNITTLPNNLAVNKLFLNNSKITLLPNDLKVNTLILCESKITLLPDNFIVKVLNLYDSRIKYLPETLRNIEKIIVDEEFLPSIAYKSFLVCLHLYKNIMEIFRYEDTNKLTNQFEQRLQQGK